MIYNHYIIVSFNILYFFFVVERNTCIGQINTSSSQKYTSCEYIFHYKILIFIYYPYSLPRLGPALCVSHRGPQLLGHCSFVQILVVDFKTSIDKKSKFETFIK